MYASFSFLFRRRLINFPFVILILFLFFLFLWQQIKTRSRGNSATQIKNEKKVGAVGIEIKRENVSFFRSFVVVSFGWARERKEK